ncbi:CCR4-NOT transcription complex subunit 11-like [Iris pallida]|uniref:CCR4-NOT transcription complex subunit 11 n=1 Tax=Iris pallida TaxID=29817 RepID=A0AAX6FRM0_IRIPA|nr:CCR4-NOT transcription complex subunit 11-like [Iris pallida]
MLKLSERLVALAILHLTYSSRPPSSNPFIDFLIEVSRYQIWIRILKWSSYPYLDKLQSEQINQIRIQIQPDPKAASDEVAEHLEKSFVQLLLGSIGRNNDKEVLKMSAVDYMKGFHLSAHVLLQREQLQKQHSSGVHQEDYNSIIRAAAVKNVIPDPDVPPGYDLNSFEFNSAPEGAKPRLGSGDRAAAVIGLLQNSSLEGLGPQWIRPRPPMLPLLDGEATFVAQP